MAVTFEEKAVGTRNATQQKLERTYIAKGVTGDGYLSEEDEVLTEMHAALTATIGTLKLKQDQTTVEELARDQNDDGIYLVVVQWTSEKEDELDACTFDFDIGGQSQKITHSLTTVSSYGTDPPDHEQAIAVRMDNGKPVIEGAEIIVPEFSFQITKVFEDTDIDATYVNLVFNRVGKVNNASYTVNGFTFAAGELLLTGASGGQSREGEFTLSFKFSARENATGLSIGGITDIVKDGWDLLWVLTRTEEDANGPLSEKVRAVYVERIYERADFTGLDICE